MTTKLAISSAHLAKRAPQLCDRDLQEGDVQHQRQGRIDGTFEHCRAGNHQGDDRGNDHGHEVDRNLVPLKGISGVLHTQWFSGQAWQRCLLQDRRSRSGRSIAMPGKAFVQCPYAQPRSCANGVSQPV